MAQTFSQSQESSLLELWETSETSRGVEALVEACEDKRCTTHHLVEMVSGALPLYAAATIKRVGGVHVFVAEDRDAAAYLLNDLYSLLGDENIFFLPSSYKRSILYGSEDANGVVQRMSTLNALRHGAGIWKGKFCAVCTYPEALLERVVDAEKLKGELLALKVGQKVHLKDLKALLESMGFIYADFVSEPGQYSIRGGIVDIFSFSQSKPYRVDFFGDEIDSIRSFSISSQLSVDKLSSIEILPNLSSGDAILEDGVARVTLMDYIGDAAQGYWFHDADFVLRKVNDLRSKLLSEMEEPAKIDLLAVSRVQLLESLKGRTILSLRDSLAERKADSKIEFKTTPQPSFNKNFELLASDVTSMQERGYKCCILSRNIAQIERLESIFEKIGYSSLKLEAIAITLHEGFIDHKSKICLYTDHQIFDRYQRYKIKDEIKRDEQMTVAELNQLKVGDYVVHYDHGVGKFAGLVKINDGGRQREAIKLIYKDNDVLFVNLHSLHRISRYKSGDGEPAKVYKLGSGAWSKLKSATKRAIKDISRELIALYAKRKASAGFAFSPDGYLQQELEASFMYEDTPDQSAATEAVKRDMESEQPMDRLICGDVGFGKTEVAIRAAFKAAVDGKQVAVLVPTTILAMQHHRSFTSRLKGLPITIEYLNRTKTAKEVTQIRKDLESGKIDILIGTHKILGSKILFKDLGLLIIDEEQKFGVSAKEKLTSMSVNVDTLTLTATPIPRTLQFSIMGSRDLSVISTPPPNRQPILTESHIFSEDIIKEAIESEMARGGQVYFVHNKIDNLGQIKDMILRLVPKARVGVGHGQMPAKTLEDLVMEFVYGEYDVLLATTIIENGIDVPNANTMIINNAHNFGMSALHQLRGRVGRSDRKAYCYLISPPEEMMSSEARLRLRAIEEFSDLGSGFNIAMQDLDIRGAGNLLGAEQSGFVADIGFEAYQKIMEEAVAELRQEGFDVGGVSNMSSKERSIMEAKITYIDDAAIDIDVVAELPDSYVAQTAEKLKLYRELDSIKDEQTLQGFAARLIDRFGAMPRPAEELLNVVRLRREAIRLGMEKVKVKNGLMIVSFVGEQNSPYYKSDTFMDLLKKIMADPDRFYMRQKGEKLLLTIRDITDIESGYKLLSSL